MAVQVISWSDKVDLTESAVADINKVDASTLNEIKGVVNNNSGQLDTLVETELWSNPDSTVAFTGKTISLDYNLDNFAHYEIIYKQEKNVNRIFRTGKIPVGSGTILNYITAYPKYRPTSETTGGTSMTFDDCKSVETLGSGTIDNDSCIPLKVLGYCSF